MKIIIAPDSFKESLGALAAAEAIAQGARKVFPRARIELVPMADGGEGTLEVLYENIPGKIIFESVLDPLGRRRQARWGWFPKMKTAVIEMAEASGLGLVSPARRNPWITTSYGTGDLIRAALNHGARQVWLTLGGVATNDAGAGMAAALGFRLLDRQKHPIPWGAAGLERLSRIDESYVHPWLERTSFIAATDVTNPLCGPNGSARVYGPQKGATPAMIPRIDRALRHFAKIVKRDLRCDVRDIPGAGAAGGAGAGALAFLKARIRPGIDLVMEAVELDRKLSGADIVVTGEGKIDGQTRFGKTPFGVARAARKRRIRTIAFCGILDADPAELRAIGLDAAYPLVQDGVTRKQALRRAASILARRSEEAFRAWKNNEKKS